MIYKLWAPTCALPGCESGVSYHKKNGNNYRWKMFCSAHRGQLKQVVDNWKLSTGCENIDTRHGFVCTSNITDASQLDVNHKDGDRHNQHKDNLEILCKVCHMRVTVDNSHHTTRYVNQVYLDPTLFEVI
jgi:hypothetical protein